MKLKKVLCTALSAMMLVSGTAFAETTESEVSMELDFIEVENQAGQFDITEDFLDLTTVEIPEIDDEIATTEEEVPASHGVALMSAAETVDDGNWDRNYVFNGDEVLYDSLPISVDKEVDDKMSMTLYLRYLKNISDNDEVYITVTDRETSEVVCEQELTDEAKYVIIKKAEDKREYLVLLSEYIDGEAAEYAAVLTTEIETLDFPLDVTIGEYQFNNNNGETVNYVLMKDVEDDGTCEHPEDEECTEECNPEIIEIALDELGSFYSELEVDKYYEIQANVLGPGNDDNYCGFISTFPSEDAYGIFTRGYSLYAVDPTEIDTFDVTDYVSDNDEIMPYVTFSDLYMYETYHTEYGDFNEDYSYNVLWVVPEEGDYVIETIGNADTKFDLYPVHGLEWEKGIDNKYTYNDGSDSRKPFTTGTKTTYYRNGTGKNARKSFWTLGEDTTNKDNKEAYIIVLKKEAGTIGNFGFRIRLYDTTRETETYRDDFTNYRDIAQDNLDNGIYSPQTNPSCKINYNGDVDIAVYNFSKGDGYFHFTSAGTPLVAKIQYVTDRTDGIDKLWNVGTCYSDVEPLKDMSFRKANHYVTIQQQDADIDNYIGKTYSYGFTVYDPYYMDGYEVNDSVDDFWYDTETDPKPKAMLSNYFNTDQGQIKGTLHNYDYDMYLIESNVSGTLDLTFNYPLSPKTGEYLKYTVWFKEAKYNANYEEWSTGSNLGTKTTYTSYATIKNIQIEAGKAYFITVSSTSTIGYDPYAQYTIKTSLTRNSSGSGSKVENTKVKNTKSDLANWDWMVCARQMAEILSSKTSGLSDDEVAEKLGTDLDDTVRVALSKVQNAACYFYSNGSSSTSPFKRVTSLTGVNEGTFYDLIDASHVVTLQLRNSSATSDYSQYRYVLLCGVDTANHKFKIQDPNTGTLTWVTSNSIFNGGYVSGNANIKLSGYICVPTENMLAAGILVDDDVVEY